jgi:hypothetical protein
MPSSAKESATRIAGLILINAMVFQEELAAHIGDVATLAQVRTASDKRQALIDAWAHILSINYVPIFRVAREILIALPDSGGLNDALDSLTDKAAKIVGKRGALRHDLMGRVYHRLLHEAKYLGTYYTSVPAATLLLKVTLDPRKWPALDWTDADRLADVRIADPACGTGTLLMATVQAITDNYVQASAAVGKPVDLPRLHQVLVESTLWGYDVLASAVHLTASTLALLAPAVSFRHMNLQVLPLGGSERSLGSVEFLSGGVIEVQQSLFGSTEESVRVTGSGDEVVAAQLPQLDLAVMNPPFTRSVGGSLLFGSLPEAERSQMQAKLRRMLSTGRVPANSTAGLGPVFIAVADRVLKIGGRQAVVVPRALVSGVAWSDTRRLLATRYEVEHVISSHDPERWNFSENTDLSEVLIVARRVEKKAPESRTTWVNLWRNPRTMVEGAALAEAVRMTDPAQLEGDGITRLIPDGTEWGESFTVPTSWLGSGLWPFHAFAQTDLVRFVHRLVASSEVRLPSQTSGTPIPMRPLGELGAIGPDRRDIHDGFTRTTEATPYPAVWGHDATNRTTLAARPDAYLAPRATPAAGRPRRPVALLWPRAGQLLVVERLRVNTHRLVACQTSEPVLSNVWWPVRVTGADAEIVSKVLALWLNSTLGVGVFLSHREETEGAWIAMKKPTLAQMPVLDPRGLASAQLAVLAEAFDTLRDAELQPFSRWGADVVRSQIDAALVSALGLPDLSVVRSLLAREPVVCLKPLGSTHRTAPPIQAGELGVA